MQIALIKFGLDRREETGLTEMSVSVSTFHSRIAATDGESRPPALMTDGVPAPGNR